MRCFVIISALRSWAAMQNWIAIFESSWHSSGLFVNFCRFSDEFLRCFIWLLLYTFWCTWAVFYYTYGFLCTQIYLDSPCGRQSHRCWRYVLDSILNVSDFLAQLLLVSSVVTDSYCWACTPYQIFSGVLVKSFDSSCVHWWVFVERSKPSYMLSSYRSGSAKFYNLVHFWQKKSKRHLAELIQSVFPLMMA